MSHHSFSSPHTSEFNSPHNPLTQQPPTNQPPPSTSTTSHTVADRKMFRLTEMEAGYPGCYAFLTPINSYCVRVNTLASYKEVTNEISTLVYEYMPWSPLTKENYSDEITVQNPKTQLTGNIIAEGVRIGESSVKKKYYWKKL